MCRRHHESVWFLPACGLLVTYAIQGAPCTPLQLYSTPQDFYAPVGTTDHLLLVDAEVGTILRVAARLEGREFYVAEVTEVAYDEQFPDGTFRLELPGVEFRTR